MKALFVISFKTIDTRLYHFDRGGVPLDEARQFQ